MRGGGGVRKEKEAEDEGQGSGCQDPAAGAGTVAVATPDQVCSDVMARVEEIVKELKTEYLFLHGELVAEKSSHNSSQIKNFRVQ